MTPSLVATRPPHHHDDDRDITVASDACGASCDADEPPVPQWALDAAAEADRADLARAAREEFPLFGDPALAGLRALELCDPTALANAGHGRAVLDGIVAAQRVIARVQALQQRWIAAFSRPGVAIPLEDVVEATDNSLAEKLGAHLPERADGETDVSAALAHPFWRPAITDTASRFAAAEIACATHLAPITARMRLERARQMVDTLPATLAAQEAGLLDGYRAAIIAEGVATLPEELRPQVERRVLRAASTCTASELRRRVAHAVLAADPTGAADRAARAAHSRHTSVAPIGDDMALFRAVLSAPDALTVHGVLDTVATSLTASGHADGRGNAQLRADVFADLFHTLATTGHAHIALPESGNDADATPPATGAASRATGVACPATAAAGAVTANVLGSDAAAGTVCPATGTAQPATGIAPCCDGDAPAGSGLGPRVSLSVHLDVATLAGWADHPGEIAGFGAVTAGTARALAASASTVRALVERPVAPPGVGGTDASSDPPASPDLCGRHNDNPARSHVCGSVVDPGRAVYRPPDATADFVRARDRHCQFPGCRTRAERCDIDHRLPYQRGGATCPCNLDVLCRAHHRLKTFTSWRAVPDSAGRLTWTSPLGNVYTLAPEPRCVATPRTFTARGDDPAPRSTLAAAAPAGTMSGGDDPPPF